MQKITFINANNDSLEISSQSTYKLLSLNGIAINPSTVLVSRGFQQNGETFLGNLLEPRIIDIRLSIDDYDKAFINQMRAHFMKVFNPMLGTGVLIYDNGYDKFRIEGIVYDGINEVLEEPYNTEICQAFDVGLYCANPAWQSYEQYSRKLVGFIGGLTLPITLPFKLATQGSTIDIDYQGTVGAPLLIEFRGSAVMPKIIKNQTGEYIEVDIDLTEDDRLFIDTTPSAINVYTQDKEGIKRSAFNYINPASSYFGLTYGKNTISFNAASGEPEVYIYWREQFVGV